MAIEAGNQIDEEAIDERSKRRAKRKKKRTKNSDNAQIENQKCFTNYQPKVAVLWSVEHDRGIFNFMELISILEKKGFGLIDDHGCWRRFRFTEGNYSRQQTLERNTPRLPYTELQGCHPCVYLNFIEDVAKWIGREETSKAFSIKIIDVSNEVSCWEDGIFLCSWKKEKWTLWYKNKTLDSTTKLDIMNYGWAKEYMSDFEGNLEQKVDEREAAMREMIRIMAYDEGVYEEWRNFRLVCLWDVKSIRVICTHLELIKFLEEIGFLTIKWESGEKQEIFLDQPVEKFLWLGRIYTILQLSKIQQKTQVKFPMTTLPIHVMGCHPLVYFLFFQDLERHVGQDVSRKTLDLRGIPVALLPEMYLDSLVYYNSTVWKQNLGYKYCRTFFIKDVVKGLESLDKYMLEFGVDDRDIKEYCEDPAVDLMKNDCETRKNKRATKNKKTRDN